MDFKTKFEAVLTFFGPNGTCPLAGVNEVYALSIKFSLVYIRFWIIKTSAKALDAVFQIAGVQDWRRVHLVSVEDVRLWIKL